MKTEDILLPNMYTTNQQALKGLRAALSHEEWMMCLGAGVSISAGLPDWYALIAQITARLLSIEMAQKHQNNNASVTPAAIDGSSTINSFGDSYYDDISKIYGTGSFDSEFFTKIQQSINGDYRKVFEKINVLETAEYLRNFIKNMISGLGESIDEDRLEKQVSWYMNYFIQDVLKSKVTAINSKEVRNSTLGAVARLMKKGRTSIIRNVITYNYDNLLEEYLRKNCKCPESKLHSIVKSDELRDLSLPKEWNIYHVHGRIPVFEHPDEPMSETVILTETDYYKEERINYSWTNIVQSYAIARANLIFIGFSGTDYNFRRIIKYVNQENLKAQQRYIFFLVDDIVASIFRKETDKGMELSACIAEMVDNTNNCYTFEKIFINYLINAQTLYWKNHGLKVIWSSIAELPTDLESLH
ncbi:MAG: SIR2 family protein [Butyrivibrio sp.]|nr:SIR2 family protein [Butyrivibrio sp.]